MARLASIEKAGYYPTPVGLMPKLFTYFAAPHGGRGFDPCSGKGHAIASLTESLGLEPYANEIHNQRYAESKEIINEIIDSKERADWRFHDDNAARVIHGDIEQLSASKGAFSFCWLNPPYDSEKDEIGGRLEFRFLRKANFWMQAGAVLAFVVPQHVIGNKQIANYLAAWYDYETCRLHRFPGYSFDAFNQVVFIGVRHDQLQVADKDMVNYLRAIAELAEADDITPIDYQEDPLFTLPKILRHQINYQGLYLDPEDAHLEVVNHGAQFSEDFLQHFKPSTHALSELQPLMPLKIGHLASLIAAGFLNNMILENEDQRLLIQGRARKAIHTKVDVEERADGRSKTTTTQTEYVITEVNCITEAGERVEVEPAELANFLANWLTELTDGVSRKYKPVYEFELGKYRDIIGEDGHLFVAQKHTAAAVSVRLSKHKDAIVVGEMGVGKTRIAAAVIRCIDARRTLILCPPHLYKKWMREVKLVNPDAHIIFVDSISDVDNWMSLDETKQRQIALMKFTSAGAASGWKHAYNYFQLFSTEDQELMNDYFGAMSTGKPLPELPERLQKKGKVYRKWQGMMARRGVRCPTTGNQLKTKKGFLLSPDTIESSSVAIGHHWTKQKTPRGKLGKAKKTFAACYQFVRNTNKGNPLLTYRQWAKLVKSFKATRTRAFESSRSAHRLIFGTDAKRRKLGAGKWRLADYIKKKYPQRIDFLIGDEVHMLKSPNTDRGFAWHRLAIASKKVLSLTGTIYGGKSSTLFYLLYRTAPDMCEAFTDPGATGRRRIRVADWVNKYGVMQYISSTVEDHTGKSSGNKKNSTSSREAPGSSPAMLPWLLTRTVFLSLADLGYQLPKYTEIPVEVDLTAGQEDGIAQLDLELGAEMRQRIARGDRSLLGAYLQSNLGWPDSPWRDEIVTDPKTRDQPIPKVICHIHALPKGRPYPKEQAIIDLIKKKVFEENENVLLLCQQTRTRDITNEWMKMLTYEGLNPTVLRVEASKREEWIKTQRDRGINVLIAHPRSIEVGLDLTEYPNIVWMGTEYSVYTVMQASRRSWRIGQDKAVQVYFFYYLGSLQEQAIDLIAQKAAAATRVNGDVIDQGGLADMAASNSIEDALTKMILSGEKRPQNNAAAFFAEANAATEKASTFIGGYTMAADDEDIHWRDADDIEIVGPAPHVPPPFTELVTPDNTRTLVTPDNNRKLVTSDNNRKLVTSDNTRVLVTSDNNRSLVVYTGKLWWTPPPPPKQAETKLVTPDNNRILVGAMMLDFGSTPCVAIKKKKVDSTVGLVQLSFFE